MKLFKLLLDFLNIHPDENQRWTLSTLFIVGLLDAYVGPIVNGWLASQTDMLSEDWVLVDPNE